MSVVLQPNKKVGVCLLFPVVVMVCLHAFVTHTVHTLQDNVFQFKPDNFKSMHFVHRPIVFLFFVFLFIFLFFFKVQYCLSIYQAVLCAKNCLCKYCIYNQFGYCVYCHCVSYSSLLSKDQTKNQIFCSMTRHLFFERG